MEIELKGVREDDVFESSGRRILHCNVQGGRLVEAAAAKFAVYGTKSYGCRVNH